MVRINLLPVRVSRKKGPASSSSSCSLVLVLGVLGNYLWAASRAGALAARQAGITRTRSEIAQLDRIIGEVKDIKAQQAELREKLDVLAQLETPAPGR